MCWQGPCLFLQSSCSPEQQGPCWCTGRATFLALHRAVMWLRGWSWRAGSFLSCPKQAGRQLKPAFGSSALHHLSTPKKTHWVPQLSCPVVLPDSWGHSLWGSVKGWWFSTSFARGLCVFSHSCFTPVCAGRLARVAASCPLAVPQLGDGGAGHDPAVVAACASSSASWETSQLPILATRGSAGGNLKTRSCSHVESILPTVWRCLNPDHGGASCCRHAPRHGSWPRPLQPVTPIPPRVETVTCGYNLAYPGCAGLRQVFATP